MYFVRSFNPENNTRLAAARIVSKHETVKEARDKRDALREKAKGRTPAREYAVTDDCGNSCAYFPL